jgi:asparagine synthetase B (glutamine-hydrolysing)
MQHGLEIRNPFLDYRVVEFAMNLPENKKISNQGQKLI